MSYSYIKSVFPNFESISSKVYDKNIYNSLNTLYTDKSSDVPHAANNDIVSANDIVLPQETLLEKYKDITSSPLSLEVSDKNKDNLRFYNLPAHKEYINKETINKEKVNIQNKQHIEKFEGVIKDEECDIYMKHILECNKCKGIVTKQLGIDNDKIKNEEIMEVVSYVIFGLFMLLLIDSLKKNKN